MQFRFGKVIFCIFSSAVIMNAFGSQPKKAPHDEAKYTKYQENHPLVTFHTVHRPQLDAFLGILRKRHEKTGDAKFLTAEFEIVTALQHKGRKLDKEAVSTIRAYCPNLLTIADTIAPQYYQPSFDCLKD